MKKILSTVLCYCIPKSSPASALKNLKEACAKEVATNASGNFTNSVTTRAGSLILFAAFSGLLCPLLVLAQGPLPNSPPAPIVTNDGSADADSNTPMALDAGDPITDTEDRNNQDVASDPGYLPPDGPTSGGNYEGPVGVTGIFNGNVATGGSYDPLSHSAHRAIDDIVVPGSIGKY